MNKELTLIQAVETAERLDCVFKGKGDGTIKLQTKVHTDCQMSSTTEKFRDSVKSITEIPFWQSVNIEEIER